MQGTYTDMNASPETAVTSWASKPCPKSRCFGIDFWLAGMGCDTSCTGNGAWYFGAWRHGSMKAMRDSVTDSNFALCTACPWEADSWAMLSSCQFPSRTPGRYMAEKLLVWLWHLTLTTSLCLAELQRYAHNKMAIAN